MNASSVSKQKNKRFPKIGMRIIKSALGVLLCFVIYFLREKHGTPFYSALAVLWCIQSQNKDTMKNALQRTIGTAIGALYGLVFILFKMYVYDPGYGFLHYMILSLIIIPIIYTTVLLQEKNASYFSCVVYLSIVINHLTDENPLFFVFDRSLDTLIGIALGLLINIIHFHGKIQKDILFVAEMDEVLRSNGEHLTPFSRFTLMNLLEEGMHLTFKTRLTPATYLEAMGDIRPQLPVIAMDGAILYDINENSYPMVYVIPAQDATELEGFLRERGFRLFTTVILDDVLLIYYEEPGNEAEKKIYSKLHRSPYRNYLKKERPSEQAVVYYMLIDTEERILLLQKELEDAGYGIKFKILSYPSDDYTGYRYIKIYNKNATVDNMIDHLKERYTFQKVVHVEGTTDSDRADSNEVVHRLHHLYNWG